MTAPALQLSGIRKRFGGLLALDLAASEEIQVRLRDAARAGMAIVYYTADLDELIAIADRVVVVFEGRVREIARDRDAIGRAMLGAA